MIENYLGFPNGISGSELATRAVVQARRFGAELLLARPLINLSADGLGYVADLSDGTQIRGRAVLFASGVEWPVWMCQRSMTCSVPASITGPGQARRWHARARVSSLLGGGNSAGQAVVRFSRYARQVTLLVRGSDLGLYPGGEVYWVAPRQPLGKPRHGHGTLYVNPAADLPDSEWHASWEDDYPASEIASSWRFISYASRSCTRM